MAGATTQHFDTIVVGGGLVGAAVAVGLAARGERLAVLDGDDRDFRASRGNFGLVWVQGKGADCAAYARLSGYAARQWGDFAAMLAQETGIDVALEQTGGYDFCLDETDWNARAGEMRRVAAHTAGEFEYEMLAGDELRRRLPQVSREVLGASYSPQDGHVNPLRLLRALHRRLRDLGGRYLAAAPVRAIEARGDAFDIDSAAGRFACGRVVVCAGLGSGALARPLGLEIPLRPLRGQLLISERVPRFLPCATLQVRQTAEGTLQIGDSHEDVGFDDATTLDVIERLAARALRIFPHLAGVRLQRAWGALRIMTPDGTPIYARSPAHPQAWAVTCHSGVTLAAWHANELAGWIAGADPHELIGAFGAERFDVSPA